MREYLAMTRDTLNYRGLPRSAEHTEINHRTKVTTDGEERLITDRVLGVLACWMVFAGLGLHVVARFDFLRASFCLLGTALIFHVVASLRFLGGRRTAGPKAWARGLVAAWFLSLLMQLVSDQESAYLFLFGPAVLFSAYLTHAIATQFAFYMTVNDQLKRRTVRRWQCYWRLIMTLVTPKRCPEIAGYRLRFLALVLAYLIGYAALRLVLGTEYAGHAGLAGLGAFVLTLVLLWDQVPGKDRDFRVVKDVTDRALRTWACYNRHGSQAAGIFRFPAREFRPVGNRYAVTALALLLFVVAVIPEVPFSLSATWQGVPTPNAWPLGDSPARPNAASGRVGRITRASALKVPLRPSERLYLGQLPPGEREGYRERVFARRTAAPEPKRVRASEGPGFGRLLGEFFASVLLLFVVPVWLFKGVFVFTAGPVLHAYYEALEAEDATERSQDTCRWENKVERIKHSPDPLEREHFYLGQTLIGDNPVLAHRPLYDLGGHFQGDHGSGKSARGMAPLVTQCIDINNASVLILDLKGDPLQFENARRGAERAGIPFAFFTNVPGRASHLFNPFQSSGMSALPPLTITGSVLGALGLNYGAGYGRAFYSSQSETPALNIFSAFGDIGSFRDFARYLKDPLAYRNLGPKEDLENARHLATQVAKLALYDNLNLQPKDAPDRPELFENQIDIPSLLRKRQVIYLYLSSAMDLTTVGPVGRLALFQLFNAAARRRSDEENHVYVFVDEIQEILDDGLKTLLVQSRSMRVSYIIANQHYSQLKTKGYDLTGSVAGLGVKQTFKATDAETRKFLQDVSGHGLYHKATSKNVLDRLSLEMQEEDFSLGKLYDPLASVSEYAGPRQETNALIEHSATPGMSFLQFTTESGYTRFHGYLTTVRSGFHITEAEFRDRRATAWPEPDEKTVIVNGRRNPPPTSGPLIPSGSPQGGPVSPAGPSITERLRRAGEALGRKDRPRPEEGQGAS